MRRRAQRGRRKAGTAQERRGRSRPGAPSLPPYQPVTTGLEHYTNFALNDIDCAVVTDFDTAVPPSRSLRRDALVLAAGMAAANAGNYGFNLVMAFLLGPEAYGALAALLALVLVGSVPGLALQAVVARRTTQPGGAAWPGAGWLVGPAGPGLVLFLHLDSALPVVWLALALAPTPLLFAVQGLLQGRERFGALAAVMVTGATVKLAIGLALVVMGLGVSGAMAGVAAGALLAALAGLRLAAPAPSGRATAGAVDNQSPPS